MPPGDVSNLLASPGSTTGQIVLSWDNPPDGDLYGVLIRRDSPADPGCPTSPTDRVQVADVPAGPNFGGGGFYSDNTGLASGTSYCYALFAHDFVPNYATGLSASATAP